MGIGRCGLVWIEGIHKRKSRVEKEGGDLELKDLSWCIHNQPRCDRAANDDRDDDTGRRIFSPFNRIGCSEGTWSWQGWESLAWVLGFPWDAWACLGCFGVGLDAPIRMLGRGILLYSEPESVDI